MGNTYCEIKREDERDRVIVYLYQRDESDDRIPVQVGGPAGSSSRLSDEVVHRHAELPTTFALTRDEWSAVMNAASGARY